MSESLDGGVFKLAVFALTETSSLHSYRNLFAPSSVSLPWFPSSRRRTSHHGGVIFMAPAFAPLCCRCCYCGLTELCQHVEEQKHGPSR